MTPGRPPRLEPIPKMSYALSKALRLSGFGVSLLSTRGRASLRESAKVLKTAWRRLAAFVRGAARRFNPRFGSDNECSVNKVLPPGEGDVRDPGAIEESLVEAPGIGVEQARISCTPGVLHSGRFGREEAPGGRERPLIPLLPQRYEEIGHSLADAFHVDVRVLHYKSAYALGRFRGDAEADRAPVIVHVEDGAAHLQVVEHLRCHLSQVVKRVLEPIYGRCI